MITLKLGIVLFMSVIFGSPNNLETKLTPEMMQGSTWRYEDGDVSYEVTFDTEGRLVTTHPNDITPANDFWEIKNNQVVFSYNDHFSIYKGQMIDHNLIVGSAQNASTSWTWKLYRVEQRPQSEILAVAE